jgi:hypothetical protein
METRDAASIAVNLDSTKAQPHFDCAPTCAEATVRRQGRLRLKDTKKTKGMGKKKCILNLTLCEATLPASEGRPPPIFLAVLAVKDFRIKVHVT